MIDLYKPPQRLFHLAGCLLVLSGCMFSAKTTKKYFSHAEQKTYDAIIVPGVPFEDNHWSRVMKGRVYWAKYLFEKGIAKNIIFSGAAVYTPYYESKIMAQYATALGIPAEHIYTETKAEHSTENIYYSYKLAKKMGFHSIALASDPFQTKMLRRYVRKRVSPDVDLIPFVVDTLKIIEPTMIDPVIDYRLSFKEKFISIKERQGLMQRLRGTRGKQVDIHAYD